MAKKSSRLRGVAGGAGGDHPHPLGALAAQDRRVVGERGPGALERLGGEHARSRRRPGRAGRPASRGARRAVAGPRRCHVGDQQADRVRPAVDGGHARHAHSCRRSPITVRGAERPDRATGRYPRCVVDRRARRGRSGPSRPRRARARRAAPTIPAQADAVAATATPARTAPHAEPPLQPATIARTASRTSRRRWPASTRSPATPRSPTRSRGRARRTRCRTLAALAALVGSAEAREHARLADAHPPVLRTHDRYGHRIDEVEFHPSWHWLMRTVGGLGPARRRRGSPSRAPGRTSRGRPGST